MVQHQITPRGLSSIVLQTANSIQPTAQRRTAERQLDSIESPDANAVAERGRHARDALRRLDALEFSSSEMCPRSFGQRISADFSTLGTYRVRAHVQEGIFP